MSIPFNRFVRITSAVGGGAGVAQRDLIARLLTGSPLVSPDSVLEFTNAADVGTYFGTTSEEYARAVAYFSFVSPNASAPERISFAAFNPAGNDAMVIGNNAFKSVAVFQSVTAGQLSIILDAATIPVQGVDLSAIVALADAAAALQTAIRAADVALAQATVTYGGIGPSRFVIAVPSSTAKLSVQASGTGNSNLAVLMGLLVTDGAVNITSSGTITAVGALQRSEGITNNFGSFAFIPPLGLSDVEALAAYNNTQNVMYQYHVGVSAANAVAWSAALIGYAGTGLTLSPISGEYPEMLPMAILAATRYNTRGATMNYMFKQLGGLTSTVSTSADADTYDNARVNYYGDTSTAGQKIAFYQRGTLMGGPTAATDMGVYGNEQWLKDLVGSKIMSLLLSVGRVPANDEGRGSLLGVIQECVDQAIINGTISIGKTLTAVQKVYITQQTGDNLAWQTVESAGYVLSCEMQPYVTGSGATEYKAVYQLIYSKDDAIRYVEGAHKLI